MAQFLGAGYHFKRIQILKDQELGCGSYGMVCKALCDELLCAAKLLHPVLVSERNVQKFHQECQILSGLKHPNIIQYLGTHNDGPTSCLLMELMEESLTSFLERSTPPLPFHTEVNLCHDISLALAYLHSNDIIHRDLSSNNVLLTADKRAKVTDFGMSRLADTSAHLLSTLTQAPGCCAYMSPEALAHTPKYSQKLDIFSMGVLIVQILTCKFPSPSSPRKKVVDKRYPRPIEIPVIETERRKAHIDLVDPTHPLLKHACACLSDEDEDRPNAQEMCHHMLELEKNEHYLKAKSDSKILLEQLQCQLKRKTEELAQMDVVISRMREDLIKVNEDISRKNEIISEKDKEIVKKNELLQRKDEELAQKDVVISRMREDLIKVNEDISRKNKIISEKDKEIAKKDELLQRRDEVLAQKEQYHETSEPNVFCVASDEMGACTTRHFDTLPQSSCVSDLYSAIAKDAGYKEGSFELYWRRQDSKDEKDDFEEMEKEEILEWKSSATLHEINMPTEPIKVKAFVRQKEDGSLPIRVSTVVIEEERDHEKKEQQRQEQEKNYCKFRLFCRRPNSSEIIEKKFEVHKDLTIPEATKEAYKLLELKSCVPMERCRLVRYDEYMETLDQSFDEPEGTTFGQAVGGVKSYYSFELFMEIRNEDQQFRVYNRGGISLKIFVVDVTTKTSKEPVMMRAESGWTVGELKKEIAEQLNLSVPTMRLTFELSSNEARLLSVDTNTLQSEGLSHKHTVFVCCDPEDFQLQYLRSTMFTVVDNSVLLYVTYPLPSLPGSSTATPRSENRSHSEGGAGENHAPSQKGEVQPSGGGERETVGVSGCENKPTSNGERLPVHGCENKKENVKTVSLRIDKRSTVENLKKLLESYVGLSSSEFKIYRLYSNNQEFEMTRLNEVFQSMPSETKLTVKLGRALLPGEYRIKVYLLRMNDPEYCVFVLDTVVSKGMSVRQFKEQRLKEVSLQGLPFELNIERLRLRKKSWRSAGTIYLDDQVFEKDIPLFSAFEVYIEQLKGPEQMKESTNMQVYIRHWHPSTYTVDPTDEVIVSESHPNHLRKKISQMCDIPWERIAIAKGYGSFPCEMSVLEIEEDLEWNPNVPTLNSVPLSIYDDGSVIYYKDSAEKLIELTVEKQNELQKHENTRLSKYNSR